jgi:hypothetical protein
MSDRTRRCGRAGSRSPTDCEDYESDKKNTTLELKSEVYYT